MAQTVAATPEIIYDTLVGDATFMAEVGEYTFKDGTTGPSISIATPGGRLPSIAKQTGLEVIIHDIADVDTKLYLTDTPDLLLDWPVFLIVWYPANGATTMAALQQIVRRFPMATSIDTVSSGTVLGVDFQTQVRIPSNCPILS
jgi:hypothetical protein